MCLEPPLTRAGLCAAVLELTPPRAGAFHGMTLFWGADPGGGQRELHTRGKGWRSRALAQVAFVRQGGPVVAAQGVPQGVLFLHLTDSRQAPG